MIDHRSTAVRWLTRPRRTGVTWGVPWPRGTVAAGEDFGLLAGTGGTSTSPGGAAAVRVQSWVTATWPDGSVKWSAHALGPKDTVAEAYTLVPGLTSGEGPGSVPEVRIAAGQHEVVVDTGVVEWVVPRSGAILVRSARREDREIVRDVRLVSLWQDQPALDGAGSVDRWELRGDIATVTVEQSGPVRAVVRVDGRHMPVVPHGAAGSAPGGAAGSAPGGAAGSAPGGAAGSAPAGVRSLLPFTVRLYFYAGAEEARLVHTVVWDGDAERDFLAGLGLKADVPMRDEPHDRHIRLAGCCADPALGGADEDRPGFLTEAVRGITGLRRDPGESFRAAQVAGQPCGPVECWDERVSRRVHLIPTWNDWTLDQQSADGFTLRKRTGPSAGWVTIPAGTRSAGFGYVGGISGGLGFGLRDFWRLYPTRLDIRDAAKSTATATVWLWSPSGPAMDLRFYHDGLGQDTFGEQLEGLEITYEDYEPAFGDARGIARTHELVLRAHAATPPADALADYAAAMNDPALLVASPERIQAAGVFGDWAPVDRSTPARVEIEDRLDFLFDFYRTQREQRRWYGFWDYGDVMHTYDADRHQWRYDVGGYAWDNSELSPDLWLWTQFLRTGRAEVFRFAEAMTRHTGEVDVYHTGRWQGLGTRHNVQHWGCSAKQLRISSAAYRRIYYFLTADERTGDLLSELAEAERTFLALDPIRKIRDGVYTPDPHTLAVGLGTDWGALVAAWLAQWERAGDVAAREKLLGTMRDIGDLPWGFLTGEALLDLGTGRLAPGRPGREPTAVSHLSAVFGLVELCSELIALTRDTPLGQPSFERAWLRYCQLYLASPAEQEAAVGRRLAGISLIQAHSRLTAYAAAQAGNAALASRAWQAFQRGEGDQLNTNALQNEPVWRATRVVGPSVLCPVDEATFVSTNDAAQYGLAAIQNLALIPEALEKR